MLTIDGSLGEGGGQILRSALALSVCLRRPFRIVNIRARRPKPGLRPQHLAAAEVSGARVEGAALGAQTLTFEPGDVEAGGHLFAFGTAGSTMLVLQTVLPALITGTRASELRLEGGTHNPRAPTFECLASAYLPLIGRMGPRIAPDSVGAACRPSASRSTLRASRNSVSRPMYLSARTSLTSCCCRSRSPAAAASSRSPPSAHTRTNIDVIEAFLPVAIRCAPIDESGRWKIETGRPAD
jgi:RNA 3'-terminal phosphate cyclase